MISGPPEDTSAFCRGPFMKDVASALRGARIRGLGQKQTQYGRLYGFADKGREGGKKIPTCCGRPIWLVPLDGPP